LCMNIWMHSAGCVLSTLSCPTVLQHSCACQIWWYMSIIPALGRQRQEDLEFKASVRNIGRACFKTKQIAVPIYPPTSSVWVPISVHPDQYFCLCFHCSHSVKSIVVMHWSWICISLTELCSFYVCWSFECLFCEVRVQFFCPFKNFS
jgi:hypothetical protein